MSRSLSTASRITLPAFIAAVLLLGAAPVSAQTTAQQLQQQNQGQTASQQNAQSATAGQLNALSQAQAQAYQQNLLQLQAQQQYVNTQQMGQPYSYYGGATGGLPTGQAQPIGFDPVTGMPIYPPPPKPPKQVLYDDLEPEILDTRQPPPVLKDLQTLPRENGMLPDVTSGMPLDIRRDALREAAVSYGARGGLAWRTYGIRKEMEIRADYLDKVYDFRQLLIPAPSGLLIEPPVISESMNAMLIEKDGQQAAVSDRIYNITNNAKIVSTARTWRNYLEREWGEVEPPPDILRPENDEERRLWMDLVAKGWDAGVLQADEIFQDDLNVLQADFQGMIRYRILLTQGMVSPPYALQVDRGITGGGDEMRIGDRAIQITGKPELITGSEQWQPANR